MPHGGADFGPDALRGEKICLRKRAGKLDGFTRPQGSSDPRVQNRSVSVVRSQNSIEERHRPVPERFRPPSASSTPRPGESWIGS